MQLNELHITSVNVAQIPVLGSGFWGRKRPCVDSASKVIHVAVCPPGKHDLSLCPEYERRWRTVCAPVLELVVSGDRQLLVWNYLREVSDQLPAVLKHVCRQPTRFHVASVTQTSPDSEVSGWLSWEASIASIDSMFHDTEIDFEEVRFFGAALPRKALADETRIRSWLTTPFWEVGAERLYDEHGVGIVLDTHCEGIYVLGEAATVDSLEEGLRGAR